jgi:O-methyltransferase
MRRTLRYSWIGRIARTLYRRLISPVPTSPYTLGEVEDMCAVHLVPPDDLRFFFQDAIEILRKRKGGAIGDYLEFGVFNGSSLGSMYEAALMLRERDMRYFGFDSFQGLPKEAEHEDSGVWKKGFYTCSREQTEECLRQRRIYLDRITFVEGWYNETLTPATRERLELKNLGIVFIDCDAYSSAKSVLDFIEPLIGEPCIICFDDWKLYDTDLRNDGEYRAFNEFLEAHPEIQFEEIESYNRKSRSFLVYR